MRPLVRHRGHHVAVRFDGRLLRDHDGPVLEYGIKRFDGRAIRVPVHPDGQPGHWYLEERYEVFRRAG